MYAPKQNQKANTQSNLWQQTATAKRVMPDAQSIASIQRDPLVQQTSQMINGPNANAHAGILNLAPANQQSSNQQLLLQWQQQYGNSYVNQVLQLAQQMRGGTSANTTPKPVVQAKLTVNRVGDKYEQEADRVAAQVVQQINAPAIKVSDAKDGAIQREAIPENEKEQDQQPELAADKPETMPSKLEKDHLVQMKPQGQDTVSGDGRGVTSEMEASIQQAQGKGEPLPDKIRKQMEQAFGADFGGVSIHADTEADEMNQSLQARAFTVGQDIFFRKGAYDPNSKQGQELLAHELTHVIQQNGSEAQPRADQDMMITKSPQKTGVQRLCSQCDQKKEKGVIQAKEVPGRTPGATVEGEASVSPTSGQVIQKDSDSNTKEQPADLDSSKCPPAPPDSGGDQKDCAEKPSICATGNISSTPEDGADGETESLPSNSIPKAQPRQTSLPRKNSSNLRPQSRSKLVSSETIPQNTQATTTEPEAEDHLDLESQVKAANSAIVAQKAEATVQALKAQVQLHATNVETARLSSTGINFALPQQKKTVAGDDNSVKQQQQRAIATSMASSFLAQGVMHVQKVTALGQDILVQIQEESKGAIASLRGTIEQQKAAVATQMSGQRDQVQSEAEETIAHIHTRYQVARAAIPQKATKVRQQTETEYAKALFTINEREREQLDQINKSYVEVCGQCKNVGQMIGAEAVAFGEEKATYWDKQKIHRDDDFWAGPLTDNRLQAKMDAAKKVAAQFKCSLINEANQQADEIQKQKPKDIQIAHTIAEQHRQQAQILQQHSLENLSGVEEQGLSQVTEAQIKLTETANQSLQSTLQFLNQEEAVQLQVLEGYGQRQILAIERDAQKAIASLQNGVNEVAVSLQNVLENSIAQFQEMEAPNPDEFSVTLANTLQRFDNAVVMVQRQTEKGIATSKFTVIQGGKQAVDAVTAIAQRGVEESATVVEETKTALAHLKKGTTHTFNEIQRGHTKTFTKSIEIAVKGFSQLKEGIQTTFEQYLKPDRFQQSLTSLEEGLRGGIHGYKEQSEECAIKYAADKAADQVQPRWKEALKWIIIIFVAIVTIVVMVVFPPGGGLLGALLVGIVIGVVSSIVVQIINNAIDGKKWSDGIGQAALAGAIGGVFGGIGGAVGQAVKIGVNIAKEVVKKALVFAVRFGIDQVFNALGTLVGDLAVAAIDHQPIDWKEIGKDIGIGAAMGVGGEALGGAAHHSLAGISNRAKVAEFGQKHPGEIKELAKLDPKNQEAFDEGVNKVAERTGMKPQEIAELAKFKQVHHAERAIRITKKFDKYRLGRFIKQRAIKIADMHQQVEPHTPADATEVAAPETTTSSETSDRNTSAVSRADTDVAGVKRPETEEKAPETTTSSGRSTHFDEPEIEPGVVAKEKTADGHEIKVLRDGRIMRCTTCADIRKEYNDELEQNPDLTQRLDEIEAEPDGNQKVHRANQLAEQLQGMRELSAEQSRSDSQTRLLTEDTEVRLKSTGNLINQLKKAVEFVKKNSITDVQGILKNLKADDPTSLEELETVSQAANEIYNTFNFAEANNLPEFQSNLGSWAQKTQEQIYELRDNMLIQKPSELTRFNLSEQYKKEFNEEAPEELSIIDETLGTVIFSKDVQNDCGKFANRLYEQRKRSILKDFLSNKGKAFTREEFNELSESPQVKATRRLQLVYKDDPNYPFPHHWKTSIAEVNGKIYTLEANTGKPFLLAPELYSYDSKEEFKEMNDPAIDRRKGKGSETELSKNMSEINKKERTDPQEQEFYNQIQNLSGINDIFVQPFGKKPSSFVEQTLTQALPPKLRGKVPVNVDSTLAGNTVRVHYNLDPKTGLVSNIRMHVGQNATAVDIKLHVKTVQLMQRYSGLSGRIRKLYEQLQSWISKNGKPPVGSRAWEAKLEVEKLPRIIEERLERLSKGGLDKDTEADLLAEIESLKQQLAQHKQTLDEMDANPGVGFVAMNRTNAGKRVSTSQLEPGHGKKRNNLADSAAEPNMVEGNQASSASLSSGESTKQPSVSQMLVLSKINIQEEWIGDVIIGGRSPSPFSGTMGAHSTAWVAHIDAVRRYLVNTPIPEGIKWMLDLVGEELESPLLELRNYLHNNHKEKLNVAETDLKAKSEKMKEALKAWKNNKETQPINSSLRSLINSYMTFVNYLPISTVKGGDPRGHGEGHARGDLNLFEYVNAKVSLRELRLRELRLQNFHSIGDINEINHELNEIKKELGNKDFQSWVKNFIDSAHDANLKDYLIGKLWSMFAIETPDIFVGENNTDKQDKNKVWKLALGNFLKTIRNAYPYSYEFTEMHKLENQIKGLKRAVSKVDPKYEKNLQNLQKILSDANIDDSFQIEASIRNDYSEVTSSDFQQAGTGFQATLLLEEDSGTISIGAVDMIGRTQSPFSNTMGAHSTAWVAHLDALRNLLLKKNISQALTNLESEASKTMNPEKNNSLKLISLLGEKHQLLLIQAYDELKNLNNKVKEMSEKFELDHQINFLEDYIFRYLTFVNFLPLSTVEIGAVPGGLREGEHRNFLLGYEEYSEGKPVSSQELEKHLMGLFDERTLEDFPPDLGERDKINVDEKHDLYTLFDPKSITDEVNKLEFDDEKEVAKKRFIERFIETISNAYPKSFNNSNITEENFNTLLENKNLQGNHDDQGYE